MCQQCESSRHDPRHNAFTRIGVLEVLTQDERRKLQTSSTGHVDIRYYPEDVTDFHKLALSNNPSVAAIKTTFCNVCYN